MRSALVLVSLLLVACASSPAAPPADGPELAEAPYSAAQIRAATGVGRTYVWRVTAKDAPVTTHHIVFEAVDEAGCTLRVEDHDEAGQVVWGPETASSTWAELESHGRFPKDAMTVRREPVTVPAGTFEARLYEVAMPPEEGAPGPMVVRFWFADALPGAPVKLETLVGGEVVELRELLEHRPGAR